MGMWDNLPTRHRREKLVTEVENDLRMKVHEVVKDLTTAEEIAVVTRVLSGHVLGMMKYVIREERNGSPDRPGGIEHGKKYLCGNEEHCSVIVFGWTGDGKPICPRCGGYMIEEE